MSKVEYKIDENSDGITVEGYLRHDKGFSRRLITKLKREDDGILINGLKARSIDLIRTNDTLQINYTDKRSLEPNSDIAVPILYEDDDVIVFDKPPLMPCHPSFNHQGDTLGNFFSAHCEGLTFRPINRLDRDTSGACVVAKNPYSSTQLQKTITKVYFAVVCGVLEGSGKIDAPISRQDESIIKRVVSQEGQRAVTHFEVVNSNDKYSAVNIVLETGRTHQIRVHFSHIGYPLAGDDMYGGDCSKIKRQALHCKEVEFIQPISNEKIRVVSECPADIQKLFKR